LDALIATRVVAILVLFGTSVILDRNALNIHSIVARKRSSTISPGAGAFGLWVGLGSNAGTSNPVAHSDLHRSLRVVGASKSLGVAEGNSADSCGADTPCDLILGPLDSVGLESADGISNWMSSTAIVRRRVALSEEIALHLHILGTNPLQIDFVQIIRFEDERADDTVSWGGSHHSSDLAKHNVLVVLHNRCIAGLVDVEHGTIFGVVLDCGSLSVAPVSGHGADLCEVISDGGSEGRIVGTSFG